MPIPRRKINPIYTINKLMRIRFVTLKGSFLLNLVGSGIRLKISCIAPIGHTQPQKSLFPTIVKIIIDNNNEKKIMGIVIAASH